jgi:hypothetical protein
MQCSSVYIPPDRTSVSNSAGYMTYPFHMLLRITCKKINTEETKKKWRIIQQEVPKEKFERTW